MILLAQAASGDAEAQAVSAWEAWPWTLAMVMSALAIVTLLWQRGVVSESRLRRGRGRPRSLGWVDGVALVGTLLGGMVLAGVLQGVRAGMDPAWADQGSNTPTEAWLDTMVLGLMWVPSIAWLLFRYCESRRDRRSLGLHPRGLGRALATAGLGFVLLVPVAWAVGSVSAMAAEWVRGAPPPEIAHDMLWALLAARDRPAMLAAMLTAAVVVAPVCEELVFRGLLQSSLVGVMRGCRWPAILATSVVFVLIHVEVAEPESWGVLLVLSIAMGLVYERTGSIWAPVAMHAAFNAMNAAWALSTPS
ncbi:MAG: type II CAAX endopeptidase family protein [Planctomycetota bacterium]